MRRRKAFTIVELLVAMALIVLIMSVLSTAFSAGIKSFRDLKALGDLQERLRTAAVNLRSDLVFDHFETGRKLSDRSNNPLFTRPSKGFFRIQVTQPPVVEGNEPGGELSRTQTAAVLHFTIKTRENVTRPEQYLHCEVPINSNLETEGEPDLRRLPGSGVMSSHWAEVAYFLVPNGQFAGTNVPLYNLHRRQRLARAGSMLSLPITGGSAASDYDEVSCQLRGSPTPRLECNSPDDLTTPTNRAMSDPITGVSLPTPLTGLSPSGAPRRGDDILLGDVISFDVKVLQVGTNPAFPNQTSPGFVDVPVGATNAYDTATIPLPQMPILAIQITIRAWEPRTRQTRQLTIIQEM